MSLIDLLMLSSATWYLSFALTNTDGPGGVFEWVREHVWHGRHGNPVMRIQNNITGGETIIQDKKNTYKNGLLDCIVCFSLWIALALALLTGHTVLDGIAVAGVSLWFHGYTGWRLKL